MKIFNIAVQTFAISFKRRPGMQKAMHTVLVKFFTVLLLDGYTKYVARVYNYLKHLF